MIKCLNCGEEFSYGRKISCCNSTYFGMIFNEHKKNHKWNCYTIMTSNNSYESFAEDFPETRIVDYEHFIDYNWNCETSMRLKIQKDLLERDYVLLYE